MTEYVWKLRHMERCKCFDANLVEIPVEVEDPGHYYYHFAFFTSRTIAALEELTWVSKLVTDYGIDFDDHDHPIKVFQCSCGSKLCRHIKRSNTSYAQPIMIIVKYRAHILFCSGVLLDSCYSSFGNLNRILCNIIPKNDVPINI
ncbi:Suppressor of variegation 3-9-related protein [Vigna angularis]|uniref:Suppressor of variegation 3-9-related protein n=1 Tax=Phaseolus angularis TaxID=3914 RepID=A0A8T0JUM0_PHAAN|nr:Suppressor of variegation 3-9-related protein [Vigna angularis]